MEVLNTFILNVKNTVLTYLTQSKDEQYYPLKAFIKILLAGGYCESCIYFITKHHMYVLFYFNLNRLYSKKYLKKPKKKKKFSLSYYHSQMTTP